MQQKQLVIESLKKQLKKDKTFLYMVIHDLKHPIESVISQLKFYRAEALLHKKTIARQAILIEALDKQL